MLCHIDVMLVFLDATSIGIKTNMRFSQHILRMYITQQICGFNDFLPTQKGNEPAGMGIMGG